MMAAVKTQRVKIKKPNDSETTQKLDKDVCACTYTTTIIILKPVLLARAFGALGLTKLN